MLSLIFNKDRREPYRILCLGAHSDDIEIGCGGTLLRLAAEYPALCVCWVVFSTNPARADEARCSAAALLEGVADKQIIIKAFRDGYFPYLGADIKDFFESLKREFSPELIFTHYRDDRHQDHRLISDLTWNTFRDHLILEYEIPKYDGDLASPNFFMPLSEPVAHQKVQHLLASFKTQSDRFWFTEDTFLSLLRLRGIEARAPERYAEAFYCRKLVF